MMALGIVFAGSFVSAARAVQLSKPTRISMARVDCTSTPFKVWGRMTSHALLKAQTCDSLRISDAVPHRKAAENDKRDPLNDVDPDRCSGRPGDPAIRDVSGNDRKDNADNGQSYDRKGMPRELCIYVTDEHGHHSDHDPGIYPVEQVGGPTSYQFREPCKRSGRGPFCARTVQESFFSEISDARKAGFRIDLRQF